MKTVEALARGFNLLAVSIVGLAGFAFAAEIIGESEWLFKLDDIALLLLALCAMWWYSIEKNRFRLSMTPVVIVGIALLIKIAAIGVEISDAADVGDDFGGVTLFILGLGLVLYQYSKTKKLIASVSQQHD